MVAVSVDVLPIANDKPEELSVTPVTGTTTVTGQVAVLLPSAVVTVMVAAPAPTAVTKPLLLTVVTLVLFDAQLTFGFVAFDGDMVAVSGDLSPIVRFNPAELKVTPATGTGSATVIAQVAVLLPSAVVTVTIAVPVAKAVTSPLLLTVATLVLSDVQFTVLLEASVGDTVATNIAVLPAVNDKFVELSATPVTGIADVDTIRALLAAE
jgi:hypothetical protein